MANTYTWDCKTVKVYLTYESLDDVVYIVRWGLKATSDQNDPQGNPYTATIYSAQALLLADVGTDFIPFADLTNEITTGWTETAMGGTEVQRLKDSLDTNIDELITPTSETKTIPEEE